MKMLNNIIADKIEFLAALLQRCDLSVHALNMIKANLEKLYGPKGDPETLQYIKDRDIVQAINRFINLETIKVVQEPLNDKYALFNWLSIQWGELLKIESQFYSIIVYKFGNMSLAYFEATAKAATNSNGWVQNSQDRLKCVLKNIEDKGNIEYAESSDSVEQAHPIDENSTPKVPVLV